MNDESKEFYQKILRIKTLPACQPPQKTTKDRTPIPTPKNQINDLVYIPSLEDINKSKLKKTPVMVTDFALVNGADIDIVSLGNFARRRLGAYFQTSTRASDINNIMYDSNNESSSQNTGICPCISVALSREDALNLPSRKQVDLNGKSYTTIEIGEYPQDLAQNRTELETMFKEKNKSLVKTSQTFYNPRERQQLDVYEYGGKKYVRMEDIHPPYLGSDLKENFKFADGSYIETLKKDVDEGKGLWFEVQPLEWRVFNEQDGNFELITDKVIIGGIAYSSSNGYTEHYGDPFSTYYQNSRARAYLNGYNIAEELERGNGDKNFKAVDVWNFKNNGFAQDVFGDIKISQSTKEDIEVELEDISPMRELINWIDDGETVYLVGPPGGGKTSSIYEAYGKEKVIRLGLTNDILSDYVFGSTDIQGGKPRPPVFLKELYMLFATDEQREAIANDVDKFYEYADKIYEQSKNANFQAVLLLDELGNVNEDIQHLVLPIVDPNDRIIPTGKGIKIPEHVTVVATGNPPKDSKAAKELIAPLQDRFQHIHPMIPTASSWGEYAVAHNTNHLVLGYIFYKYLSSGCSDKFSDINYLYEDTSVGDRKENKDELGMRGKTNTLRKWSGIAASLDNYEKRKAKGMYETPAQARSALKLIIDSSLRGEWAKEFFDYCCHPTLTPEQIVNGEYTEKDLAILDDMSAKFRVMGSLLSATPDQVGICRDFIAKYCDKEYLAVYDLRWEGIDKDRMKKISELKTQNNTKQMLKNIPSSPQSFSSNETISPETTTARKPVFGIFGRKNKGEEKV